jgi:hypothetical protein
MPLVVARPGAMRLTVLQVAPMMRWDCRQWPPAKSTSACSAVWQAVATASGKCLLNWWPAAHTNNPVVHKSLQKSSISVQEPSLIIDENSYVVILLPFTPCMHGWIPIPCAHLYAACLAHANPTSFATRRTSIRRSGSVYGNRKSIIMQPHFSFTALQLLQHHPCTLTNSLIKAIQKKKAGGGLNRLIYGSCTNLFRNPPCPSKNHLLSSMRTAMLWSSCLLRPVCTD